MKETAFGGMIITGSKQNRSTWKITAPLPLCQPQILNTEPEFNLNSPVTKIITYTKGLN
jgi:hypothetical protein